MKRVLLPFISLTGILWLTAGWLAWISQNGGGMTNILLLGGIVTGAAIYLLRTCVSLMSARMFVALLIASLFLFNGMMLLRWDYAVWQSIMLAAAFVMAVVGLTIGVDKLAGTGWQFSIQQLRGLLAGSFLLIGTAYLLPGLVFLISNVIHHQDWLSRAGLWLATFRFP